MDTRTTTLQSAAGEKMHLRIWQPPGQVDDPPGSVILAHGLAEHAGRYTHVARFFTERGFAVYGPDFVGFGQSGGKRGHIPGGVGTCVADLQHVLQLAKEKSSDTSREIFLGHSMGGLFVLRLLLDHPQAADGAIVAGPALHSGKGGNPLKIAMVRVLSFVRPSLTIDHGYQAKQMSTDPNVVEDYLSDPLVHRQISMGLAGSILKEGKLVRDRAGQFHPDLSMLLLHGEKDLIAKPDVTQAFGKQTASENKQVHILEGMRHEVFNEVEKERAFQVVEQFFDL